MRHKEALPFSAFIDQKMTKLALILLAIEPDIGGLLVKGEKGSGKSSLVRSFTPLLPKIEYVKGCKYHCDPADPSHMCAQCRQKLEKGTIKKTKKRREMITLPIGATVDTVTGSLNLEQSLHKKEKNFQPGILARANRNILYIDEINLLPDHLTDVILDAAASGWNYVEREGISIKHPSNFILIGTMNPEEGELRPQLLDRLSLSVSMNTLRATNKRVKILQRNLDKACRTQEKYRKRDKIIKKQIKQARTLLSHMRMPSSILTLIAQICEGLKIDGHRADIVTTLTAKALAAYQGRILVKPRDVEKVLYLTLSHRTRKGGALRPPTYGEIMENYKKVYEKLKDTIKDELNQLKEEQEALVEGKEKRKSSGFKVESAANRNGEILGPPTEKTPSRNVPSPNDLRRTERDQQLRLTRSVTPQNDKGKSMYSEQKGWRGGKSKAIWKHSLLEGVTLTEKGEEDDTTSIPLGKVTVENFQSSDTHSIKRIKVLAKASMLKRASASTNHQRLPKKKGLRGYSAGRRAPVISNSDKGRVIGYTRPKGSPTDIALVPTLRRAALRSENREFKIRKQDIREKKREHKARAVIALVIDASKSMERYILTIGKALIRFHKYAWRKKDKIGIIHCQGERAEASLDPTSNSRKIMKSLSSIACGGKTPLASGLLQALRLLEIEKRKNPDSIPLTLVLSDGLGNVPLSNPVDPQIREEFSYPSQADIIAVSRLYSNSNIPIVLINPLHLDKWEKKTMLSPTFLLKEIGNMTQGAYVGFREGFLASNEFTEETVFSVLKQRLTEVLENYIMRTG